MGRKGAGLPSLDLADPADMPLVLGKGGVQEGVHDLQGQALPHHAAAQGQHIGVVMQPGRLGAEAVRAQRAADAGDLVGRDGDADTGAADDDAPVTVSGGHRQGSRPAEIRIVAAGLGVGAEVVIGDAPLVQMGHHGLLQGKAAVVAGNSKHNKSSSKLFCYCTTKREKVQGCGRNLRFFAKKVLLLVAFPGTACYTGKTGLHNAVNRPRFRNSRFGGRP